MSDDDQRTCHEPGCGGFCDRPCADGARGGCIAAADLCDRCGVCSGCGWEVGGPMDTARSLHQALAWHRWSSEPVDDLHGVRAVWDQHGEAVGVLDARDTWALIKAMEVGE